jgi:flagellar hook assembly protein FlgD
MDVTGRLVRRLLAGPVASGRHEIVWDGRQARGGSAPSGVYFARITIGNFVSIQKLALVK